MDEASHAFLTFAIVSGLAGLAANFMMIALGSPTIIAISASIIAGLVIGFLTAQLRIVRAGMRRIFTWIGELAWWF